MVLDERLPSVMHYTGPATVVLHGRTLNKLEVIYDEIESLGAPRPPQDILPLQLSSASPRDYETLTSDTLRQTIRTFGWYFA